MLGSIFRVLFTPAGAVGAIVGVGMLIVWLALNHPLH